MPCTPHVNRKNVFICLMFNLARLAISTLDMHFRCMQRNEEQGRKTTDPKIMHAANKSPKHANGPHKVPSKGQHTGHTNTSSYADDAYAEASIFSSHHAFMCVSSICCSSFTASWLPNNNNNNMLPFMPQHQCHPLAA